MRKHLVRIALLAVLSLGFIGIIGAAPASAGNCSGIYEYAIWYDGHWNWTVTASQCNGFTAAQIMGFEAGNLTGIRDNSTGVFHVAGFLSVTSNGPQVNYNFNAWVYIWGSGCGAPAFSASQYVGLRFKSGTTWGPWHQYGPRTQMLC